MKKLRNPIRTWGGNSAKRVEQVKNILRGTLSRFVPAGSIDEAIDECVKHLKPLLKLPKDKPELGATYMTESAATKNSANTFVAKPKVL